MSFFGLFGPSWPAEKVSILSTNSRTCYQMTQCPSDSGSKIATGLDNMSCRPVLCNQRTGGAKVRKVFSQFGDPGKTY